MNRATSTSSTVYAGCFTCRGSEPIWQAKNAMALAARHHDSTGHPTWAEQVLSVKYGEAGPAQPDMFSEKAA